MRRRIHVLFKTPMRGDMRLALAARSPARSRTSRRFSRPTGDAMVQTWRLKAIEPLRGQTIGIDGLETR